MNEALRADRPLDLPVLVVTGASGLVGRNFIEEAKEKFFIYAIARRSQKSAGVATHPNIRWQLCDIGDSAMTARTLAEIAAKGGADFVLHFAGYYDFTNRDSIEFERTNVGGTRNILDSSRELGVKRFIFSSSLAVTNYAAGDVVLTEESPADFDHPYTRSKKAAEELVSSYSGEFPCTIARLAAVYSDWCEYAPLYILLNNWLSKGWRRRFIVGKGNTSFPYLHTRDLNAFFFRVMVKSDDLPGLGILLASPSGCVSHNKLFESVTGNTLDRPESPIRLRVAIATAGAAMLQLLGKITGHPTFERPWMMRYIDSSMNVDAEKTHRALGWDVRPRYHILRRLLFLAENMRDNPVLWEEKNHVMTKLAAAQTYPGLKIHNAMQTARNSIIERHADHLLSDRELFLYLGGLNREEILRWASALYDMLETSIRLGERAPVLSYARYLARKSFDEGAASFSEIDESLKYFADLIELTLLNTKGLEGLSGRIHREITVTTQLILDEIEDIYEQL